jgi:hypothetical protein
MMTVRSVLLLRILYTWISSSLCVRDELQYIFRMSRPPCSNRSDIPCIFLNSLRIKLCNLQLLVLMCIYVYIHTLITPWSRIILNPLQTGAREGEGGE